MSAVFAEEVIKRKLRDYYNEVMEITESLNEEEMTLGESEKALILLDAKYAQLIVKELER